MSGRLLIAAVPHNSFTNVQTKYIFASWITSQCVLHMQAGS